MAILVPGPGFIGNGLNWIFFPPPNGSIMGTAFPRMGTNLNIWEIIGQISITAVGTVECGTPPTGELITSITVSPCSSPSRSGKGVTVLLGGVGDIPEMLCPIFNAPFVTYNTIAGAAKTLILPQAINGYYTEKYLWDAGIAFSEMHMGSEAEVMPLDNIRAVSRGGYGVMKPIPKPIRMKRLRVKDIPRQTGMLPVDTLFPKTLPEAMTVGPSYYEKASAGSNYLIGYPPSLIRILRFFFTIKVTTTCPPYVYIFFAHLDVENNWDHHKRRVAYRVARNRNPPPYIISTK